MKTLVVRELVSDLYYGEPRGFRTTDDGREDAGRHAPGAQVQGLPAGHAGRAAGVGDQAYDFEGDPLFGGQFTRQYLESQRLQGVASKNGRGLIKCLVAGWFTAPQVIIIDTGIASPTVNASTGSGTACARWRTRSW